MTRVRSLKKGYAAVYASPKAREAATTASVRRNKNPCPGRGDNRRASARVRTKAAGVPRVARNPRRAGSGVGVQDVDLIWTTARRRARRDGDTVEKPSARAVRSAGLPDKRRSTGRGPGPAGPGPRPSRRRSNPNPIAHPKHEGSSRRPPEEPVGLPPPRGPPSRRSRTGNVFGDIGVRREGRRVGNSTPRFEPRRFFRRREKSRRLRPWARTRPRWERPGPRPGAWRPNRCTKGPPRGKGGPSIPSTRFGPSN